MKHGSSSSYSEEKGVSYPSAAEDTAPLNQPSAPPFYGTFQANQNYPQPIPPNQQYTVQGYPVAEGMPMDREFQRLPCCGIGIGCFLFLIGWFLATVPWFVGAFLLVCTRYDPRERVGLVCCTVGAILAVVAAIVGGSRASY